MWTGLGQVATVAQLVGTDAGGLICKIIQAAQTARQNRKDCEQLARRVFMIAELLPHLQVPEAAQQLAGLGKTLQDAHELIVSCQGRSVVYQFVMAGRQAERFREVQRQIDFYLILFPVISHIGITRRLQVIYNILVPYASTRLEPLAWMYNALLQDDSTRPKPHDQMYHSLVQNDSTRLRPSFPFPESSQLQEVSQDVLALAHETQEFTRREIFDATNDFAVEAKIEIEEQRIVYEGKLHGREVHVVHMYDPKLSRKMLDFLSSIRHENITPLLGWSLTHLELGNMGVPTMEALLVYEYMPPLFYYLTSPFNSPVPPVIVLPWKIRINVLLGVSRAIEHLHHASPPIALGNISLFSILVNTSWVAHLSVSVGHLDKSSEEPLLQKKKSLCICCDPDRQYRGQREHQLKPTCDVYYLGVAMLEVLFFWGGKNDKNVFGVCHWALPIIKEGKFKKWLNTRRRVPKPTPGHLQGLKIVAQTAVCCLQDEAKARPAISDVVTNLEMAFKLIDQDVPSSS